jgi:hypothetical protein
MDSTEDRISKVDEPKFAIAKVLRLVGEDHSDNEFLNKVEANIVSCVEDLEDINNNRASSLAIERGLRMSKIPNHRITEIIAELRKSMRSKKP